MHDSGRFLVNLSLPAYYHREPAVSHPDSTASSSLGSIITILSGYLCAVCDCWQTNTLSTNVPAKQVNKTVKYH